MLLFPLLLLAFFIAAPKWYNAKLHARFHPEIRQSSSLSSAEQDERIAKLDALDFQQICNHPTLEHERLYLAFLQDGIVTTFQIYQWSLIASATLVVLLAGTMVTLVALNNSAAKSTAKLAANYRLSWQLTMAVGLIKVLVLIPLLAYGTFEFSVLATDHFLPKLLLLIVIGGCVAIWGSVSALLKPVPMEFAEPMSREMSPQDAPQLWAEVRQAAERLQTTPPDRIVLGTQFSFYVTELSVITDTGRTSGRTLYLSYPLLNQLSRDEVLAIIGHELGHFKGEDTRLTREFYPIRRKVDLTTNALGRAGWVGRPSWGLVTFFALTFEKTIRAVSRQREFQADQVGAALTSPSIFARALVRFQVLCDAFPRLLKDPVLGHSGNPVEAPWHAFIAEKILPDDPLWTQLSEQKLPHPLDTHPPLHDRLDALQAGVTVADARAIALRPDESAAASWFTGQEPALIELTQVIEKAMGHLQARTQVATADLQTTEGKALLDRHFPEIHWTRKGISRTPATILLVFLGALILLGMVIVPSWAGRFVLLMVVLVIAGLLFGVSRLRPREWNLNAEGITNPRWKRRLHFADVESLQLRRINSAHHLKLKFKTKQKALGKWSWGTIKTVGIPLDGLNEKPAVIAETIHRYFTRQI